MDWMEVETRVKSLRPDISGDDLRGVALLFAILLAGRYRPRLQAITGYDDELIRIVIDDLDSHGQLVTGSVSAQFVLSQCPGAEELIKELTGVAPVKIDPDYHQPVLAPPVQASKGRVMEKNGTEQKEAENEVKVEEKCKCGKPAKHMGRCQGPQPRARRAVKRASRANRSSVAERSNGNGGGSSHPDKAEVPVFAIYYKDGDTVLDFKGTGLESFLAGMGLLTSVTREQK